jgi:hypothetical protein
VKRQYSFGKIFSCHKNFPERLENFSSMVPLKERIEKVSEVSSPLGERMSPLESFC